MQYGLRDISRDDASRVLRINLNSLDVMVHRFTLGERRKGARLFSLRDLATIKSARALAGPEFSLDEALQICGPPLAREPHSDDVLIVTDDAAWIQHDHDDWPECNCSIVPVGRTAKEIKQKLEAL
ncbi:hypothetical protein [Phyllobacterium sp. SB3]|uniref:hypothetical protein n=1 Tax=Phyllobacterium sp. SB3 TaxID=3156073 RepID=UPI0032AECBD4